MSEFSLQQSSFFRASHHPRRVGRGCAFAVAIDGAGGHEPASGRCSSVCSGIPPFQGGYSRRRGWSGKNHRGEPCHCPAVGRAPPPHPPDCPGFSAQAVEPRAYREVFTAICHRREQNLQTGQKRPESHGHSKQADKITITHTSLRLSRPKTLLMADGILWFSMRLTGFGTYTSRERRYAPNASAMRVGDSSRCF